MPIRLKVVPEYDPSRTQKTQCGAGVGVTVLIVVRAVDDDKITRLEIAREVERQ
jgi:hypothetical protein